MTPTLASIIATLPLVLGGVATAIFGRRSTSSSIPGLLFHSVVPSPSREMSHFPLRYFERFCTELALRHYIGTCVRDAYKFIPLSTNDKRLLLTFDDGFSSFFHHALPVLDASGLKVTLFCLGDYFGKLSQWDVYTHNRHLSRQEIAAISDHGHEIGSHTMSHPCLPYLNERAIRNELIDSRKSLEDITGKAVTSLSFPYGAWNRRIWDIAKESGYTAATLYRGKGLLGEHLYPVLGAYRYETVEDLLEKIEMRSLLSPVRAYAKMMSHFARGTPVWKYRKEYIK